MSSWMTSITIRHKGKIETIIFNHLWNDWQTGEKQSGLFQYPAQEPRI